MTCVYDRKKTPKESAQIDLTPFRYLCSTPITLLSTRVPRANMSQCGQPEAVVAFFGWTVAIIAGVLPDFPTKVQSFPTSLVK